MLPIERLNSVVVITPRAAYLDEARRWIERLDQPSNSSTEARLHVYAVRNGSARHLGEVLNGIYGSSGAAPAGGAATGVAPGLSSVTARTSTSAPTSVAPLGSGGGVGGVGADAQPAASSSAATTGSRRVGSRIELMGSGFWQQRHAGARAQHIHAPDLGADTLEFALPVGIGGRRSRGAYRGRRTG